MNEVSAEERMQRARSAQSSWADTPLRRRVRILRELRREIARQREEIVATIVKDTGKPVLDALAAEVVVTLEQMLFYELEVRRILAPRRVKKNPILFAGCSFHEQLEPHGVAVIYAAANFPFQLAMVPAITALFAGNAVVLKVSERAPSVGRIIQRLCESTLPENLVQVAVDEPKEAARYIDAKPDIIFFTGSTENGKAIASRASAQLIPVILELGGKDPAIVLGDCDLERTVEGVTYGAFANAGQVCVGIKRLYIERPIYRNFLNALLHRASSLRVGSGADCDLGNFKSDSGKRLAAQVQDAIDRGATLEAGGNPSSDAFTILSNVPAESRLLSEDTFGPVLCVDAFDTEGEAVALSNSTQFALGASVWTRDLARGRRIASAMTAGGCAINDVIRNVANPFASFGGNAASGYGRYHGPEGLRAFSRIKSVMVVRPWRRHELHWFPYTQKTLRSLEWWIDLRHRSRGWIETVRRLVCLAFVAAFLGGVCAAKAESEGHLQLRVQLPANKSGIVAYAVFSSSADFPDDRTRAVRRGFSPPSAGAQRVDIDTGELPPGRYAVAVYLDENGNHKLDFGMFGIPKEPVGTSNNPRGRLGPPRFNECAFQMGADNLTLSIKLVSAR